MTQQVTQCMHSVSDIETHATIAHELACHPLQVNLYVKTFDLLNCQEFKVWPTAAKTEGEKGAAHQRQDAVYHMVQIKVRGACLKINITRKL